MEVVHERCCGVDVHKQFITACRIVPGATGKATKEIETFRTMPADLERFRDWLLAAGCTHVAMESTGVYWKPLYNLLEETDLTVLVVNAQHIKTTSTDYPHGKHGFVDDHRRDNRSSACALRSALPAA